METRKLTFQFAIDRGGTFTDVFAKCSDGRVFCLKLLSENPAKYLDAPTEGIRRIFSQALAEESFFVNGKINGEFIEWIRMGTTVATNALLERKGEQFALVVNSGFKDVLRIGNQARPEIFSLDINIPKSLYSKVVEVPCRVVPEESERSTKKTFETYKKLIGTNSKKYVVLCDLDEEEIRRELSRLKNEQKINSVGFKLNVGF